MLWRISQILYVKTLIFSFIQAELLENQYGILVVEPNSETNTPDPDNAHLFCLVYYPSVNNISAKANATKHPLTKVLDLGDADTCEDGEDLNQVEANFAYINGSSKISNCSVAERAARLERYKAVGMISDRIITGEYNSSEYNISIEVLTLVERDAKERLLQYKTSYPEGVFYIYENGSDEKGFDLSLVVILVMAVMTVTLGSFWSGHAKHNLRLKMQREAGAERLGAEDPDMIQPQDGSGAAEEELSIHVSPLLVLFFVLCMCSMLVLLYFFFNQLVYVIMTMFCIASSLAMYSCLEPLVMASYSLASLPVLRLPRCNLYLCVLQLELRQFLLLLASIATSATWFVFRKTDWSWILQDILGIMFSINMLKVLRLPSLKICTILLSALFFYDIFFVFITPLFMEGGKSVMVEVATGGNSDEQLPMVLRVPHLSRDPSRVCYVHTYSLLGFGDILVPGLLLSFAHSYDLLAGIKYKLFWAITSIAYILGLVATFISLFLMNSAQPALLYLVPFTLLPTLAVSWLRGDLAAMWHGDTQAGAGRERFATTNPAAQTQAATKSDDYESEEFEDEDSNQEKSDLPVPDSQVSTPDDCKLIDK